MANIRADRVRETTTTGTGALALAGAVSTYQAFSSVMSVSDTCYYAIGHQTANEWETGLGTYSGANTLTRTTVIASSNSNSAVSFAAGTKDVFLTMVASKSVITTGSLTSGHVPTFSGTDGTIQDSGVTISGTNTGDQTTSGTTNRISVSSGSTNPVVDIDASYAGQSTITTLGTVTTGTWSATAVGPTKGGTGQTSYTLGDTLYSDASNSLAKLAGNTTSTKKFLRQTGNGSVSAAPAWDTVTSTDVGLGSVENTALSTWAGSTNITTLGTVSTGTWSATTVAVNKGGTGQTSYTDGQLLIGNTSGNTLTKATLTAGSNVTITNGNGSITIAAAAGSTGLSLSLVRGNIWS